MSDANEENSSPQFSMEKIYVKDLSLEIPHAPKIFMERENPQIEVQVQTVPSSIEQNMYEVEVVATVTAKVGNRVMFLIEAKQAGIFQLRNVPTSDVEPILAVMCPNILFPYLREVVSDMSVRAGFAPALMNPINFEALYQQRKQQLHSASSVTAH